MTSAARTSFPRSAIIAYLVTVGAIFVSGFFPGQRLWGLNWYGYFDWPVWLALVAAVLVIPLVMFAARKESDQVGSTEQPGRALYPLLIFLIIVVAGVAFYLFRAQTHFLGDGMFLAARLEGGGPPVRPWNPAIYFVLHQVYDLLGGEGNEAAVNAYRIISWTGGLGVVLAAGLAAVQLFKRVSSRLLFVLGLATGGYALMFFGYVENYALFVLCVVLFSLTGLLVLHGKLGRYWPILPLVLAGLFHPFAVALVPGCGYLIFRGTGWARWLCSIPRQVRIGAILVGTVVVIAVGGYFYTQSSFFRMALVPVVAGRFTVEGYTLFSPSHLTDWLNLLLVLSPTLPLALVLLVSKSVRGWFLRAEFRFIMLIVLPSLALAFLFDPKLGMPRDWDMFGFAGVPLTLLFYYMVLDRDGPPGGHRLAGLGLALSLLMLGPRVGTQIDAAKSIALFDNYAALDKIKSRSGRFILREWLKENGREVAAERRRVRDNQVLPQEGWDVEGRSYFQRGQVDSAVMKFRQAIRFDPTFYLSWANLGVVRASQGQNDSALAYLAIADGLMPSNPDNYNNLGGVYYGMGDYVEAEKVWKKAVDLSADNFVAVGYLTRLYQTQNRIREHDSVLLAAVERDQAPLSLVVTAADRLVERAEYDAAARLFRRGLAGGLDTALVCARQAANPQLKVVACED